ncbi:hypothetical protein L914_09674 [Phytophthora nicotianae]|uniref:Ubiquitin-like protease family profile domain-containing protein n=1 Tax=Phytophthora nicotianae TaxID=4792 RepID=W2N9F7_PHYNI|nr:hypothetical protein L914_09674 [Phytophthora nicotianae]
MERLSGLSSPAFCTALQAWKELVQRGLREGVGAGSVSDTTTSPDEDDETDKSNVSDAASDIEPTELIDTMDFIRQMKPLNATQTGGGVIHKFAVTKEPTPSATQTLNVSASHVGCRGSSSTEKEKVQVALPSADHQHEMRPGAHKKSTNAATHAPKKCSEAKGATNCGLEVIRIPHPKPRHNQRKKLTQSKLVKHEKPQKLAAITLPDKHVPSLSRLLEWANHTTDPYHVSEILGNYPVIMDDAFMGARTPRSCREFVCTADYDYNFVIPQSLVIKLNAVVAAEKKKHQESKHFNVQQGVEHPEGSTNEVLAFFPGGTPRFTSSVLLQVVGSTEWLSISWEKIRAHPEVFDEETGTAALLPDVVPASHQQLADDIVRVLEGACLSSTFRLDCGEGTVMVEKMVGMVARDRMLSDTIIDFGIRCICESIGNGYALDSFAPSLGCPRPPEIPIESCKYVVLPVHLSDIHWGVIIADISYRTVMATVTPYFYEPLCSTAYNDTLQHTYETVVAEFLKVWHDSTMPGEPYPIVEENVWLSGPKQRDGTSCGVLVLAQVYTMLKNSLLFTRCAVSHDDVTIMRLRIMWMILRQPEVTTRENKVAKAVQDTDIELLATIKT